MTERETWLELARLCGLERREYERRGVSANTYVFYGLCHAVRTVATNDRVERRMRAAIRRELDRRRGEAAWAWPLSASGFKRRGAWCRQQAARLSRKSRSRKSRKHR